MRWTRATAPSLARCVAAALALLCACSTDSRLPSPRARAAGSAVPTRGGTLTVSVSDDVRSLDPAVGYDEYSLYAQHLLFDTLLGYGPSTSPDPTALVAQLAEAWEVSDDGLVYRFTIREGAQFWNGESVDAADFVYALDRVLSPEVKSPGAHYYLGVAGARDRLEGRADHVAGIRALDQRHLEIRIDAADPAFPLLLAMKFATPLKRDHVERVGQRIRDTPLGTGPFLLAGWEPGQWLDLARNDAYWDSSQPYLDAIRLRTGLRHDVAVLEFLNRRIDIADRLSADDYVGFASNPDWAPYIVRASHMGVVGAVMNVSRPPFDDVRVRRAMNYAISKVDTIRLASGRGVVAHGVLPPRMPAYDPSRQPYPHDPARARDLLAEAGYADGFRTTYTVLRDPFPEMVAQSIQADLAEVGVEATIQTLTLAAFIAAGGRGDLDLAFMAWNMDFPDPRNFLEPNFHSRNISAHSSNNRAFYRNAEVDRLLDAARAERDEAARLDMYRRAEGLIFDDGPWIWHYHAMKVEVRQPYVRNYAPHPIWVRDFRDVWLDLPRGEDGR